MKRWQWIIEQHHPIWINEDDTVTVYNVFYHPDKKEVSNDLVTRIPDGYMDRDGNKYESIWEYLGY